MLLQAYWEVITTQGPSVSLRAPIVSTTVENCQSILKETSISVGSVTRAEKIYSVSSVVLELSKNKKNGKN